MTITLTREEAQQVLDALEMYLTMETHDEAHILEVDIAPKAIELLRARLAKPDPEQTRSEKMREAGYTKRDTRLECDECGKKFTRQMLPVHDCQPEPEQQLEWDEVFDYATAAYCRSSASKETLRLCFQHRNPQQEQVAIPWTANELMDFAKGIASIYNTPPVRQADSEPVANASAWFALVMNAAAEIEDASYGLRDEEAKRKAISGAKHYRDAANALYTAPPQRERIVYCGCGDGIVPDDGAECGTCVSMRQREWQSLTDEEIADEYFDNWSMSQMTAFARAIEAKLREKNT